MISADLSGRKALVTGGASGLGLCAVDLFSEMDATVAISDISAERIAEAVTKLTGKDRKVIPAQADLRDPDATASMVRKAAEESTNTMRNDGVYGRRLSWRS